MLRAPESVATRVLLPLGDDVLEGRALTHDELDALIDQLKLGPKIRRL